MRIIAGKYKGRIIKFPKSKLVRPTTDKNKESIFNYLVHTISFDGINILDLYAGSGSLGLEGLSRGAESVHFVEIDFRVSQMLFENISSLGAEKDCKIFRMDALKFAKQTEHDCYDLIIADPPFFKDDIHVVKGKLAENNFLKKNGLMIIERSIQTKAKDIEAFNCEPFKRLGDSLIYKFEL